jgi:hypothetical protein
MPIVKITTQPLRKCLAAGITREEIERIGGKIIGPNVEIDSNAPGFLRIVKRFKVKFRHAEPKKTQDLMVQLGPPLWADLHRWALTTPLDAVGQWLAVFRRRVPCGKCRREFTSIVQDLPAPATSNDDLFAWTVEVHNRVNRKLGKPEMSVEAARPLYFSNE